MKKSGAQSCSKICICLLCIGFKDPQSSATGQGQGIMIASQGGGANESPAVKKRSFSDSSAAGLRQCSTLLYEFIRLNRAVLSKLN